MNFFAALVGVLLAIAAVGLVRALLLRAAGEWLTGREVPFGKAYRLAVLILAIEAAAGVAAGFVFRRGWPAPTMQLLARVPADWLMVTAFIGSTATGFVIGLLSTGRYIPLIVQIAWLPVSFAVTVGLTRWVLKTRFVVSVLTVVLVWSLSIALVASASGVFWLCAGGFG